MHPRRRHAALRRLEELRPSRILFVCLGNICRSPFAAHLLEQRTDGRIEVSSGGFIGPGRPPPERALRAAADWRIDHSSHASRLLSVEMLEQSDAVFVFDRFNVTRLRSAFTQSEVEVFWLGDLDPQWGGQRAISDPWGKPLEEFERTFARIERCVAELVRVLGVHPAAPDETQL